MRSMGQVFDAIEPKLAEWMEAQPLWFVSTAPLAEDGHVDVSPRGHDTFSVLAPNRVGWVDDTGSGERDLIRLHAEKKGPDGMDAYRAEMNAVSIDGLPGL